MVKKLVKIVLLGLFIVAPIRAGQKVEKDKKDGDAITAALAQIPDTLKLKHQKHKELSAMRKKNGNDGRIGGSGTNGKYQFRPKL